MPALPCLSGFVFTMYGRLVEMEQEISLATPSRIVLGPCLQFAVPGPSPIGRKVRVVLVGDGLVKTVREGLTHST